MCTANRNYILDTVLKGVWSINQSTSRKDKIVQERPDNTTWGMWIKFLRPLCHTGSSKMIGENQLGNWISTIQNSHRLWFFYYSSNKNTVYRGYREDWHSNTRYQFGAYQGDNEEVFEFDPVDRNIDLKYMPGDAVTVDIAYSPRGWRVCQHQLRIKQTESLAPITDFIQFAQSQPDYISQYYSKIVCEILEIEMYNEMKATSKIIMATDGGAIQYKGSLGFVLTTSDSTVLLSCYNQPTGLCISSSNPTNIPNC